MRDLKVTEVMTHLVVTFRPQDTIYDAAQRLLSNRISGAPVTAGGRLVGVVSETDLVRALAPGHWEAARVAPAEGLAVLGVPSRDAHVCTVGEVMATKVVSIGADDSVWEAASLIDRHGVRRLPVVDDEGFVMGVLTRSDLVRAMAQVDQEPAGVG
ncbi:MAG: CBS domain-containing protein [Actinomycetota bacterium]|nr:CBS domain-containing protein [Actinomycetota bacterium]